MKKKVIIVIAALALTGVILLVNKCGKDERGKETETALAASDKVRTSWLSSERALEIGIVGQSPILLSLMDTIGIDITTDNTTPDEQSALMASPFVFDGKTKTFKSPSAHAVVTDSVKGARLSYPYYGSGVRKLELQAPFGENLYGIWRKRNVADKKETLSFGLKSSVALLSIKVENTNISDVLESVTIYGDSVCRSAQYEPYQGRWSNLVRKGKVTVNIPQRLSTRQKVSIFVPPVGQNMTDIDFVISGKKYTTTVTIPPLKGGTKVSLTFRRKGDKMMLAGSSVEDNRPLLFEKRAKRTDIKEGEYLNYGGTVTKEYTNNSYAVVLETDGVTGIAVALNDAEGQFCFGDDSHTSKRYFPTIDGKLKECILNPEDNIDYKGEAVVFKPSLTFPKGSALSVGEGAKYAGLLSQGNIVSEGMTKAVSMQEGAFVPSLREMALLFYKTKPYGGSPLKDIKNFEKPTGEYLTSTESDVKTFYMIDMTNGIVTGFLNKKYTKMKLRMFYVF